MDTMKFDHAAGGYICPRCRTVVEEGARFCFYCGLPLSWERAPMEEALELVRKERARTDEKRDVLVAAYLDACGPESLEDAARLAAIAVQIVEKLLAGDGGQEPEGETGGAAGSAKTAEPAAYYATAPALPDLEEDGPLPAPAGPPPPQVGEAIGQARPEPGNQGPVGIIGEKGPTLGELRHQEARGHGYQGCLFLRCAHCGEFKAFYTQAPIHDYHCRACGGVTPLGELSYAILICECGNRTRYMTNAEEPIVDVPCIRCGSPVSLEYREGRYLPIRKPILPRKGGKKRGRGK